MEMVSEAICFAAKAFDGKKRKSSGTPAVFHSLEAASIAATVTSDMNVIAATVLHDTVEDAGASIEEIRTLFGDRVAELVAAETENKYEGIDPKETWWKRKTEAIEALRATDDVGVKVLYLGDKLSNLRSIYAAKLNVGDELWKVFHQTDPKAHYWYYTEIEKELWEFSDSPAFSEYSELIKKVFEGEHE